MYFVYILKLKNGNYYTGYTSNLKRRLLDHNHKLVISTKSHSPTKLVFYAVFTTKLKALGFEKYLKTSSGFAFRNKRLLENN